MLGAHVTRVTDVHGKVTRIICTEYDSTGTCLLMQSRAGGPLSQLLERVANHTFGSRDTLCVLREI